MIENDPHFDPDDTIIRRMRVSARTSRGTRETVGNTTGIGAASCVLWVAGLVGVDMPPDIAVVIGGFLSTVVSSLVRKRLSR